MRHTYPQGYIFASLWAVVFVLYIPAINAGFVADVTGWLQHLQGDSFWQYINRTGFHIKSQYQFTQFTTYIFYQLFGIHKWLWHLLQVTMQAIDAYLLYYLCRQLFNDVGIKKAATIAYTGAILFCISPYLSEVIVWEAAYHYLQGLLIILLVLVWVQKYLYTGHVKYAWYAGILYFLSTFSLEIFYITPWLVLSMSLYYRLGIGIDKKVFGKTLLYFFLVELVLFLIHLVTYRILYGSWVAHIGEVSVINFPVTNFGKPARYLFHILFLGRFFPPDIVQAVYKFCYSVWGLILFYLCIIPVAIFSIVRFRRMDSLGKAVSLLFLWVLITLALLVPVGFYEGFLVTCDRYTYFTDAFLYMLLALLASYIPNRYARTTVVVSFALVNLRFTIKVVRLWSKSEKVIYGLLHSFPDPGDKTVIILNLPEVMQGVQMIDAQPQSEYKLMHNLMLPRHKITNKVYDGVSYNMITPADGAHVSVLNDSTIRVTLNQWGTWWWYNALGALSYKNADYSLNIIDEGHFYELTLKKPADQYMLLYQVGDQLKVVDWNKKNQDQN